MEEHRQQLQAWRRELDQAKKDTDQQLSVALNHVREAASDQAEQLDNDANVVLTSLNDQLEKAKRIVNVVGNVGITGNYQRYAEAERKAADRWRWIAVGAFLLAALSA